jgi:hypothetical protein
MFCFCARCGQQLPDATETCLFCGKPANWVWQPAIPPPAPSHPASASPALAFYPPSATAAYTPPKVGGALLFFCICFTILWPLWILSETVRTHFYLGPFGILSLARLAFMVVVGVALWMRHPAAMVLLRIHLVVGSLLTAYSVFSVLSFVLSREFVPVSFWPALSTIGLSVALLVSGAIYFSLSERVRSTYGSKLFGGVLTADC